MSAWRCDRKICPSKSPRAKLPSRSERDYDATGWRSTKFHGLQVRASGWGAVVLIKFSAFCAAKTPSPRAPLAGRGDRSHGPVTLPL